MRVDPTVDKAVKRMKLNATLRDQAMNRIRMVRDGDIASVWPEQFSEVFPKSIVANFVDVVARDLAEVIAPPPTLNCSAGAMRTEADKKRANRNNRIGDYYWRQSRLNVQMSYGADQYLSYGFLPFYVEPDYKRCTPIIQVIDPMGSYFEVDRWLDCRRFSREWSQDAQELASEFPELANQILKDEWGHDYGASDTRVIHYVDTTKVVLYLPDRGGLVLAGYEHGLGECPVHIALRPGLHLDPRGQFDDVLFVQVARAVMAQLALEAGHKAVQAPIAVPDDVTELNIGPDAVIQTASPEKVRRVSLEVPQVAFALEQQLDIELKTGSRYPDARTGNAQASVITGKGVEALMGSFDTQIKSAQDVLGLALKRVTELCFRVDKKLWPKKAKKINGLLAGESYEITYIPGRDIADIQCDVTYGFATGLSPQNSIVALLQLRGDKVIDRDTFRRNLPMQIDIEGVQRALDIEDTEEALKQGLFAGLQAAGQMMANGMSAQAMQFFNAAAMVVKGRQQGKPMADLMLEAFKPPEPSPEEQAAAAAGAPGAPGAPGAGPGGIPGTSDTGLPDNVAPGQAGMAPGGMPTIQSLVSGFHGGQASMDSSVRRRIPTG